jgi:hypothetical protein
MAGTVKKHYILWREFMSYGRDSLLIRRHVISPSSASIIRPIQEQAACWLLVWTLFDCRNAGSTFFRKVDKLIPQYIWRHISEDRIIFQYTRWRILKEANVSSNLISSDCRLVALGDTRGWRMWIIRKLLAEIRNVSSSILVACISPCLRSPGPVTNTSLGNKTFNDDLLPYMSY